MLSSGPSAQPGASSQPAGHHRFDVEGPFQSGTDGPQQALRGHGDLLIYTHPDQRRFGTPEGVVEEIRAISR
jgi:hypothetical protein